MDFAAAVLGFFTGVFGLALAFITLWTKVRNGIKATVLEVLVEAGLVKPTKDRDQMWPDGSDTLPDYLNKLELRVGDAHRIIRRELNPNGGDSLRDRVVRIEAQLHAERLNRFDDPDGTPV